MGGGAAVAPSGSPSASSLFSPATVPVGQTSTLTLVLQNCSSQTVQGQSIWTSKFTWAGTGLPVQPVQSHMPVGVVERLLGDPPVIETIPSLGYRIYAP